MKHLYGNYSLLLLAAVLFIAIGVFLFPSAGRDDSFITYWPAQTLSHNGEMLNYNAQRVEQSSSLAHVLTLALAQRLTNVDIVTLGKLSSVVFGILTLALFFLLVSKTRLSSPGTPILLLATLVPFCYWAFGGLETTLMSASLLGLSLSCGWFLSSKKISAIQTVVSFLVFLFFATVRPESTIVLTIFVIGLFLLFFIRCRLISHDGGSLRNPMFRRIGWLFLLAALSSALVVLFRILYFGDIFPQPVTAKSEGISIRAAFHGLHYIISFLLTNYSLIPLAFLAITGIVLSLWRQATRPDPNNFYEFSGVMLCCVYVSFIIFSGGGYMEGGRFIVHVLPLMLVFLPSHIFSNSRSSIKTKILAILLALNIVAILVFTRDESTGNPLWTVQRKQPEGETFAYSYSYSWFVMANRVHTRDIPTLEAMTSLVEELSKTQKDGLCILSGQMGMVPFYLAKRFPGYITFVDRNGLADRSFSQSELIMNRPTTSGGFQIPYDYYFKHKKHFEDDLGIPQPDIVFDLSPEGGARETALEKNGYILFFLQQGDLRSSSKLFPGDIVRGREFIYVREKLWPLLEDLTNARKKTL